MSREQAIYGNFTFSDVRITVRSQYVYDSDGRTLLGTQYGVSVSGWITGTQSTGFKTNLTIARSELSKSFQRFRIHDADLGTTVLDLDPNSITGESATHDYGPRVVDCTISEISGLQAARINWQMEAFRKDCGPSLQGFTNGILSIQRTYSYSIDIHGYATRSVSGTLKCTRQAGPADLYRSLVDPPQPNRFQRIQRQFSQSPDGLTLTFAVTDQEKYATLPPLIADGEATWGVKLMDLGARVMYVLNGRFKGGATTPKPYMFQALLLLIQSKFPLGDPSFLFEEASVDDSVYDNEISFSIVGSGVVGTLTNQTQIFNALFKGMLTPPPQSNGQAFITSAYGALPGTPHVAKNQPFYDACQVLSPEDNVSGPALSLSTEDAPGIPSPGGFNDDVPQDNVSAAHLNTPFVEYNERISYHFDYKLSRMDRKDDGATVPEPSFSQSSRPSVIATQAGYLKCYAKAAGDLPPIAPIVWPSGKIREAVVTPDVGEPVADGSWKLFTVHWRYVVEWKSYLQSGTSGDSFVTFPVEPRLGGSGTVQGDMSGKAPFLDGPGVET